jgi:predicted secreted protein
MRRARAFLAALIAFVGAATAACAGDRALMQPIGYSPDARYFAFSEFGIQDGSGFAYANVHVIDLVRDAWVEGSPFRAQASEADADEPLAAVRQRAEKAAAPVLAKLAIAEPAEILALTGDGVADEGTTLSFATEITGARVEPDAPVATLSLTRFDLESPKSCTDLLGGPAKGFAISLTAEEETFEVHRDTRLPQSRFCPMDYRLYAVLRPLNGNAAGLVALVSTYPFGFEGPDRRFLAVPLGRP